MKELKNELAALERAAIARELVAHQHNRTHTAKALGIARRTLLNKIRLHGLTTRGAVLLASCLHEQAS